MLIKVLGAGCPNCKTLELRAKQAAEELKMPLEIREVQDIEEISHYGLNKTPGLVINGKVVLSGYVPMIEELKDLFAQSGEQ
ncbi:MAG TPA: thioredoxin family protein [Candidatus Acidoferrales bacterium]|nr:thioredoxin family protein [Candidatus Acidoferrales bacterium]